MTSLFLGPVKDFGRRLRIVGLLPAAMLVALVLTLLAAGAPGRAPSVDRLSQRLGDLSTWQGVGLVLGVALLVLLIQPGQIALIRLLEGYWGASKPAAWLAGRRRKAYQDRRDELDRATRGRTTDDEARARMARAAYELRVSYPERSEVMPTRLGNVLAAAESRAGQRYGFETITVWPRLYSVLPDRSARMVDDQREQLDFAANLCMAMLVAGVISAGLLVTHPVWLLVPCGTLVLSWLAYRGAVAAGQAYGDSLEVAFDLHRFDLLSALHLPLPKTRTEECEANEALSAFLLQELPTEFTYEHPEPLLALPSAGAGAGATVDGSGSPQGGSPDGAAGSPPQGDEDQA